MIFGLLLSSMIVGNLISRFGKWKAVHGRRLGRC